MTKFEIEKKYREQANNWRNEISSLVSQIDDLENKLEEARLNNRMYNKVLVHIGKMDDEGYISFTVPRWFKDTIEYCTYCDLPTDRQQAYDYFIKCNNLEDVNWEFCDDERNSQFNDLGNTKQELPVLTAKVPFEESRYGNVSCN